MKNGPTCAVDLSITGLFQEDIRPIELHAKLFCKTSTNYGYDLYPGGIALGRSCRAWARFLVDDIVHGEEAGQVMDLEIFLPTLHRQPHVGRSQRRLCRMVMLDRDHHQLPPTIQFGPYTGRCRPSLAALYQ